MIQFLVRFGNLHAYRHDFALYKGRLFNVLVVFIAEIGLYFTVQGDVFVDLVRADAIHIDGRECKVGCQINVDRHISFMKVDTFSFSTIIVHVVDPDAKVNHGGRHVNVHVFGGPSDTFLQDVYIYLILIQLSKVIEKAYNDRISRGGCLAIATEQLVLEILGSRNRSTGVIVEKANLIVVARVFKGNRRIVWFRLDFPFEIH
mmetsp:Transcript_736/g.1457  ORF Transcript_736/g.1457 Transcript_736/m.1457 type:complete len:203 (+) Transcript_736:563-1171(+)